MSSSRKGDVSQADKSFMGMPVSFPSFVAISITIATAPHLIHRSCESHGAYLTQSAMRMRFLILSGRFEWATVAVVMLMLLFKEKFL